MTALSNYNRNLCS